MSSPRSGLVDVLAATVFAGVASYVITWLVPRVIGFAEYQGFAAFWSALYLVVGTLAGLQQEVARSTYALPADAPVQVNRARRFGLVAAVAVVAVTLASAPLWSWAAFPQAGWSLVFPLAVGVGGYALVAVLGGTLQGLTRWRATALLVSVDAALRLLAVGVVLLAGGDIVALAWAAAIPFGAAIVSLWPVLRPRIVGRAQLDVGYRRLTWNVSRTVTAAAATAVMVSGFPLLFSFATPHEDRATVGMIMLAATLVRAPLVVVAQALQTWLLVQFRDHPEHRGRRLAVTLVVLAGVGAALTVLAAVIGSAVFAWLYPAEPIPGTLLLASLVASSTLVAAMIVTGAALLSAARHHAYTIGWVVGAVATIGALVVPLPTVELAMVALLAGPAAGLVVHLGALAVGRSAPRTPRDQR